MTVDYVVIPKGGQPFMVRMMRESRSFEVVRAYLDRSFARDAVELRVYKLGDFLGEVTARPEWQMYLEEGV